MIRKIISGAQTGADQGGLAAALILGLDVGGSVPRGRRTSAGPLTDEQMKKWKLVEHSSDRYPPRTEWNVKHSDGTVIFGNLDSPGSQLTWRICQRNQKPYLRNPSINELRTWVHINQIRTLNVAGNREDKYPGIFQHVVDFLVEAFKDENS